MIRILLLFFINLFSVVGFSQLQFRPLIFAHNDYLKPNPFYNAYSLEVDYIEADIFLKNGELLVAHTRMSLNSLRTLDSLYLKPLRAAINKNNGLAYASGKNLTLMIDLKTDGKPTLNALVEKIKNYPELVNGRNFTIAVSGSMPEPSTWKDYPEFIHFDGRPSITYTADQLLRVVMISDNFRNYSHWNGVDPIKKSETENIIDAIKKAHELGKPVRFWAIPDSPGAWKKLIELEMDILNTDNVNDATAFMKER